MDEDDWFSRYIKPFDPSGEGTEEDGNEEEEATREEEPKEINPDEKEAAGEQEGEPEGARRAKGTRAPIKPSKEEVDEHMLTHLPFRSWCPHCVRGKSKGKPHRRAKEEPRELPTVALDYTFMHESQEKYEEEGMPILVAKDIRHNDTGTGMIFARWSPRREFSRLRSKHWREWLPSLATRSL